MPIMKSFLMCKPFPILEMSQELSLRPFQVGGHTFILPIALISTLSSALSIKHPNLICLSFHLGAVCVWVSEREGGDSPFQ